jgi:hypothetical protein
MLSPGTYVRDTTKRSIAAQSLQPSWVYGADDHFVSRFTDTSLSHYEITAESAHAYGYPLGLQFQQDVYASPAPDEFIQTTCVVVQYEVINVSADTLHECYLGQLTDMDLGSTANDHVAWYAADTSLQAAVAWTDREPKPYGMLVIAAIETPVVSGRWIDNSRRTDVNRQLGVTTALSIRLQDDPKLTERYDALATPRRDPDSGPAERQELHASGPFDFRPGDTVHFAIGYMVVDGTWPLNPSTASRIRSTLNNVRSIYYNTTSSSVAVEAEGRASAVLSAQPNPAGTSLTIRGSFADADIAELTLVDPLGRSVLPARTVAVPDGHFTVVLDVSSLSSGLYFAVIRSNDSVRTVQVVIGR